MAEKENENKKNDKENNKVKSKPYKVTPSEIYVEPRGIEDAD